MFLFRNKKKIIFELSPIPLLPGALVSPSKTTKRVKIPLIKQIEIFTDILER